VRGSTRIKALCDETEADGDEDESAKKVFVADVDVRE